MSPVQLTDGSGEGVEGVGDGPLQIIKYSLEQQASSSQTYFTLVTPIILEQEGGR